MTTAGSAAEADAIAEALVVERLAACVQTAPVHSRYVWKGEMQKDDEVLLLVKTRAELFQAVRARIRALHAYETPEVLMVHATAEDADYLAWLEHATDPE